jgi:hypothetical protein
MAGDAACSDAAVCVVMMHHVCDLGRSWAEHYVALVAAAAAAASLVNKRQQQQETVPRATQTTSARSSLAHASRTQPGWWCGRRCIRGIVTVQVAFVTTF